MAKIIKLTPEYIEEIRREFEESLRGIKLSDGKISYNKSFGTIQRKATVYFTSIAWKKMQALIKECDKEVAWHGVAYRSDDPEKDEYLISDIMVYPQEVTGATVTTDQAKYQTWLMSHDDEVFNNIRMQGHSHVNMGTTPSGVDTSLYERILDQLDDSMFYIFLIYNKRNEKTYKIYDLEKNVLFETADVDVKILEDPSEKTEIHVEGLSDDENQALTAYLAEYRDAKELKGFLADAKEKVTTKTWQSPYTPGNGYSGYNRWDGYGKPYSPSAPSTASTPPAAAADTKVIPIKDAAPAPSGKKEQGKTNVKKKGKAFGSSSGSKHRKGRRKDKKGSSGGNRQMSMMNAGWADEDDPYGAYGYSEDEYWD